MKSLLRRAIVAMRQRRAIRKWARSGRPLPPPHALKAQAVREYARRHGTRVLVESGTYRGDMILASLNAFRRIYSIELGEELCAKARERFASSSHVVIIQGDSARILPQVLGEITEPSLFWLDGHYSQEGTARGELDTPIREEVRQILEHPVEGHVLLIDDARLFTGDGDYPTLEGFRDQVLSARPDWVFEVKDDIIRAHPREAKHRSRSRRGAAGASAFPGACR